MSCMAEESDAYSVLEGRLVDMAEAVREGDFDRAESIGGMEYCGNGMDVRRVPLAVPRSVLEFTRDRLLSEGAQSSVLQGSWKGMPVAIKRGTIRERQDLVRFRKEVCMLGGLSHENIVPLLGARMLPPDYLMVMELFEISVGSAIHEHGWRPSIYQVLNIGSQIALALDFLHSRPRAIVHRDVKPANILLQAGKACLADFGISDFGDALRSSFFSQSSGTSPSGGFHKANMVGTLEYMAPEILLKREPASPASDVYALCVTINEILSCIYPYADCTKDNPLAHTILEAGYSRQELAVAVAAEGLRPTIPQGTPAELRTILTMGWHADPSQRPSASYIAKSMYLLSLNITSRDSRPDSAAFFLVDQSMCNVRERIQSQIEARGATLKDAGHFTLPENPYWALVGNSVGNVPIGSFATAGRRGEDNMEDRSIIVKQPFAADTVLLAGIFDGHRGTEASDYLASHFETILRHCWTDSQNPSDLLTRVLREAERNFQVAWHHKNSGLTMKRYPGTTALCLILCNNTLTVANIGDSRAMLCRGGKPEYLSEDQVAGRQDEQERMHCSGHASRLIQHDGDWRIGSVGLAVTRSIGDYDMKLQGVIADPELTETLVDPESDSFVVLASDGVWDVMTGEDVIDVVMGTVKQPAMCAQRIVMEALTRGSEDNASVVIAFLDPRFWTTFEKVS